ncbi:MAG: DoxX family protein, partial [Bacteroidota bacterium]
TGVVELVAGVLLLTRKWNFLGGFLGIGLMSGAIFFHLTSLGIEVQGDGGYLFYLALAVMVSSIGVLIINLEKAKSFVQGLTS